MSVPVKGLAHITGGGLIGNVPRILPEKTKASSREPPGRGPRSFEWLQREGKVAEAEMQRVFNCGIGMAVVVAAEHADATVRALSGAGETVFRIGRIEARKGGRAADPDRLKNGKAHRADHPGRSGRTALAIGCLMVLKPFLAALLSAAILCFSTWPLYRLIERRLGGRRTLAALAMTLLMILVLVLPLALIAGSYVDDIPQLLERLRETLAQGLAQPSGLGRLDPAGRRVAGHRLARDSPAARQRSPKC